MKLVHMNMVVPPEMLEMVKKYAADHDLNISQVVRKALRQFFEGVGK